MRKILD